MPTSTPGMNYWKAAYMWLTIFIQLKTPGKAFKVCFSVGPLRAWTVLCSEGEALHFVFLQFHKPILTIPPSCPHKGLKRHFSV